MKKLKKKKKYVNGKKHYLVLKRCLSNNTMMLARYLGGKQNFDFCYTCRVLSLAIYIYVLASGWFLQIGSYSLHYGSSCS